ncbi:MAG: bifunctional UDP-N-acetylglucosamine diphosphorylase/glucosamine-1-phosphate N-acetyltransferase GlmU [Deltaproteobacteria bacterium]|nr:bifunctional UDP-N-acetylglucosamine diphosphorylase/glucosamine-1-phosphate N-acetyltransferase GlmU [Deltaproteobacteria bacterium]MBW2413218.1 bifunctional UDP-N-acetylglucosamine diphosphorylase/glucosamine-1-phosphate N-acetyltransferase GlmU [Deltaproteobacteria bacterium]
MARAGATPGDGPALLVLAAGEGTRMRSRRPKLLHPVCGRSILRHVVRMGQEFGAKRIVLVVGAAEAEMRDELRDEPVEFVRQVEPLGTGHAALQARDALADHAGPVVVMAGDHPLYRAETMAGLVAALDAAHADLLVATAEFPETPEFGRIVRGGDGRIREIVEHRDASEEQKKIREVGLSLYVARAEFLFETLARVDDRNSQGEYYLTDIVRLGLEAGHGVTTSKIEDWSETLGVNSRVDLAEAERLMRRRIAEHWMLEGVTFEDPERSYVDADVTIGPDTRIAPGASLRGRTQVGSGCRIGEQVVIESSTLGDDVFVKPLCHIEESTLGNDCTVGPAAHLRPGSKLEDSVRIGNFVEVKNSTIGRGTKADHLSYIGDSDVGAGCTIACGAITVNYDGTTKNRTVIGDGSFIGCNANLIAPIEIEPRSYVAAGSTITKKVTAGSLAVARAKQRNIEGWFERRFGADDSED